MIIGMEKSILRKAFRGYLPDEILYRQKEQFSDGVGYHWIDILKGLVKNITDSQYENKNKFPINTPIFI